MAAPDEGPSRRRPVGWVLVLIGAAVLLALVWWGVANGARDETPAAQSTPAQSTAAQSTAAPAPSAAPSPTAAPGVPPLYGAMSIVRSADGFDVTGEVPDPSLKAQLPLSLRQAMPGARIVDDLTVTPGVTAPEIAGLGGLFGAALEIPGFSSTLRGDTVTLAGRESSADSKEAAESSAKIAWPNVKVVNDIQVTGAGPAQTPPAKAPSGGCADLSRQVADLVGTPITFATDGSSLGPDARREIARVAEKVGPCPGARLVVTGYADASGTDAINVPLSAGRATAVAAELVAAGLPAASVSSTGAGSANPVAANDTAAGRAQNRRVEITVG